MSFTNEQTGLLKAPLSSANIKTRKMAGRTLSYLEGWVAIAEANRIFGHDGWDRQTVYCKEVSRQEVKIGQQQKAGWKVGYEAKVRITVAADSEAREVVREGTGHGNGTMTDLFDCIESAAKEAETDAMKRALMTFGNPFGLALYDKEQKNVSRDGGMSNEADQHMADNIGKVFDKPAMIPVPDMEDEKAKWVAWSKKLIHALDSSKVPDDVDLWLEKNGVPLVNLGLFSETAYDSIQAQAEKKKEKLAEAAGLDMPNTGLGAG